MSTTTEDWRTTRLRFCLEVDPPAPPALRADADRVGSLLPMEAIGEQGTLDLSRETSMADASSGMTFVADGDVLLAKVTPCFENGKGAVVSGLKNGFGFATTEVYALRPIRSTDVRFLDYLLRSETFRQYGAARLLGAGGLKRLSATDLRNFEFVLPNPEHQRAIADFLDRETARIDTLIEEQQRLIDLLWERRCAIRTHCALGRSSSVGETVDSNLPWAGCVPKGWEVVPLSSVARLESGHTPSRSREDWWQDCHIPWISLNDVGRMRHRKYLDTTVNLVSDEGIANSSARVLPAETVVLSRDATVGRTAIMSIPMATSQHFAAWICGPRLMPEFLWTLFTDAMQPFFDSFQNGSTIRTIGMGDLKAFRIPLPPLDQQRRIVADLDEQTAKIDVLIAESERFIELSRARRSALITAAVTGQIDVRDEVAG